MATSQLGTSESQLGVSLVLGAATSEADTLTRSVTTAVVFSQTASFSQIRHLSASNTVTFTSTAGAQGTQSVFAENTVEFTSVAYNLETYDLEAESSVSWQQSVSSGAITAGVDSAVTFSQDAHVIHVRANAYDLTGESTITFTDSTHTVLVSVDAVDLEGESSVTFGQYAGFPTELTAENTITFTGETAEPFIWIGRSEVTWTHTASYNIVRQMDAENAITFVQAVGADGLSSTKTFSVAGSISLTKPTLERQSGVRFYTLPGGATEITLSKPVFGNRQRLAMLRINRESRGGDLTVYGDTHWPQTKALVMEFINIKEADVDGVLSFLADTIGQEIGFDDWEGRSWTGIITNPDAECVENNRGYFDISIDFEGELA